MELNAAEANQTVKATLAEDLKKANEQLLMRVSEQHSDGGTALLETRLENTVGLMRSSRMIGTVACCMATVAWIGLWRARSSASSLGHPE